MGVLDLFPCGMGASAEDRYKFFNDFKRYNAGQVTRAVLHPPQDRSMAPEGHEKAVTVISNAPTEKVINFLFFLLTLSD